MSVLNDVVLVLNKSWVPINILNVKDAICSVATDSAKIIDTDKFYVRFDDNGKPVYEDGKLVYTDQMNPFYGTMYSWDEWIEIGSEPHHKVIRATSMNIRVPEIITLTNYNDVREIEVRLTRRNVFMRDNWMCQYCGCKISSSSGTVDHIIPKSRGGKNSWDNFATSCFPCNVKKRDRTPHEAGMALRTKPAKPKWYPLSARFSMKKTPESWKHFLPENAVLAMAESRSITQR